MSTEQDINAAMKAIEAKVDKLMRKVSLDVQRGLDLATPVDTGRARSNWLGNIGSPANFTSLDKRGSERINFSGFSIDKPIHITNNLSYIQRLNDGSSKQAPSGFVERVITRVVNNARRGI